MKSFNRIRRLNQVVGEIIEEYNLNNIVVADVATDHGYLAEILSRNERVSAVIATDISQACLDKASELKQRFELDKIELKLGDGLQPIDQVDLVVMAGIGGYEIIRILNTHNKQNNGDLKCKLFVLQPSKNSAELRLYLIEKNYKIVRDFIVYSGGRFYPIIVADLNQKNDTENCLFNVYFGRDNSIENKEFLSYLNRLIKDYNFFEKMKKNDINNSDDLITKFKIYKLAKNLLKKSKGE